MTRSYRHGHEYKGAVAVTTRKGESELPAVLVTLYQFNRELQDGGVPAVVATSGSVEPSEATPYCSVCFCYDDQRPPFSAAATAQNSF